MKAIDRMYFNKYAIDPDSDFGEYDFQEDVWQPDLESNNAGVDVLDQEVWTDFE